MQKRIEEYLRLMKERPEEFVKLGAYNIVTGPKELEKFDSEENPIGVIYRNKWIIFVIDLIDDGKGKYIYSRILHAQKGAGVVTVPVFDKKIVLVKHIRHAVRSREYMLELPRGYLDPDTDAEGQVVRELEEEIGACVVNTEVLGRTIADGGKSGGEAVIVKADISGIGKMQEDEGIIRCELMSIEEAECAVADGRIVDGFTQTALYLYKLWLEGQKG